MSAVAVTSENLPPPSLWVQNTSSWSLLEATHHGLALGVADALDVADASGHQLLGWRIDAYYRFGAGAWQSARLRTEYVLDNKVNLPWDNLPLVPKSGGALELFFVNRDDTGCITYDSRFGANYRFQ